MTEIGGYLSLELAPQNKWFLHQNCIMLNSGHNALEYILLNIKTPIHTIYIPYYTCDSTLIPIKKLNLHYEFYLINYNLELCDEIHLGNNDYIIVNNYFGIKDKYIQQLSCLYGSKLIIDSTQAWYAPEILGLNMFFSPRKFFGLPDGGAALCNSAPISIELERDHSYDRFSHLLKRLDSNANEGYSDFKNLSNLLRAEPIKFMSNLTYSILSQIDFDNVATRRRSNYEILEQSLSQTNLIKLPHKNTFACPLGYPYFTKNKSLRKHLIDNKVFVPIYWPNVTIWTNPKSVEHNLAQNLLMLPIDQRYDIDDMNSIIQLIQNK